ncbi:hypothetical protein BSKO_12503 [Bryopsis sp. KO-2023]|nr:hypothetical protein BSKO_12503 [Bryopsis sp. KO-2023]
MREHLRLVFSCCFRGTSTWARSRVDDEFGSDRALAWAHDNGSFARRSFLDSIKDRKTSRGTSFTCNTQPNMHYLTDVPLKSQDSAKGDLGQTTPVAFVDQNIQAPTVVQDISAVEG